MAIEKSTGAAQMSALSETRDGGDRPSPKGSQTPPDEARRLGSIEDRVHNKRGSRLPARLRPLRHHGHS